MSQKPAPHVLTVTSASAGAQAPTTHFGNDSALEEFSEGASASPLWMVTTASVLNQFILDLQHLKCDLQHDPDTPRTLHISRAGLETVRRQFLAMIRHGQADLHRLAQLLCATFLSACQIESVVIGEVASTHERFTLTQQMAVADVYGTTDLALGTRQLNKP